MPCRILKRSQIFALRQVIKQDACSPIQRGRSLFVAYTRTKNVLSSVAIWSLNYFGHRSHASIENRDSRWPRVCEQHAKEIVIQLERRYWAMRIVRTIQLLALWFSWLSGTMMWLKAGHMVSRKVVNHYYRSRRERMKWIVVVAMRARNIVLTARNAAGLLEIKRLDFKLSHRR